jgi:hypothetical protein
MLPAGAFDLGQHHAVRGTEGRGIDHRLAQFLDQLLLVLDRALAVLACAVDGQRLFQRGEDVGVIDDHAAVLAGEDPVGAGDGLHQRVVAHRLVEIHRRAARRVEAGQPHGADEDQAQRVVGVLELLVQPRLRLVHALAVRLDVEPELLHLLRFRSAPARRSPPCRCWSAPIQPLLSSAMRTSRRACSGVMPPAGGRLVISSPSSFCTRAGFRRPVPLHLVVHAQRGGLVDRHHHRLADRLAKFPARGSAARCPAPPFPAGRRG